MAVDGAVQVKASFRRGRLEQSTRCRYGSMATCPGSIPLRLTSGSIMTALKKLPALGQEGRTLSYSQSRMEPYLWEMGNVARDKIKDFEVSYGLSGNAPGEGLIKFLF